MATTSLPDVVLRTRTLKVEQTTRTPYLNPIPRRPRHVELAMGEDHVRICAAPVRDGEHYIIVVGVS